MAEHLILFAGDMVRASRERRKTQTRRVMKPQPIGPCKPTSVPGGWYDVGAALIASSSGVSPFVCPYGVPGDTLVPRTTWATEPLYDGIKPTLLPNSARIWSYWDSDEPPEWIGKRRPGRFLPKRFWHVLPRLANKDVRVQRVQEISYGDAEAEGVPYDPETRGYIGAHSHRQTAVSAFRDLWDSINAARGYGWNVNPLVWALTFEIAR